jgi:serine/threonine protein kinase
MSTSADTFDRLFCEHCGAALPDQAITCPVCGEVQGRVHALLPQTQTSKQKRPVPGTMLTQRYRIIEQVGEGGFGVVYKAQDRQKHRMVAIKQITLADLSTREIIDATDSYNRETTILPRLTHRNLPVLYDYFTDPEHWYIVMEYIEGQTLEEMLSKATNGRLPLKKVLTIGKELCHALAYLHSQQPPVVFRDVKPGNIMITKEGKVYLIDFGIARRHRAEKKRDTGALGSPGYAAPEQYGSEQSTPRTDLYGLGATLQTMLTGKEPTEGADIEAEPEVPRRLKDLIVHMLEKDPKRRPENVLQVESELDDVKSEQLQKISKDFVSPFAWLAALLSLLLPLIKSVAFQIPISYTFFLIFLGFYLFTILSSISKERQRLSRPLTRKEMLQAVNKRLSSSKTFFVYIILWNSFSNGFGSTSFLIYSLFMVPYDAIVIFTFLYLHKAIKWIQIVFAKRKGQKIVETEPLPQQMSQRP